MRSDEAGTIAGFDWDSDGDGQPETHVGYEIDASGRFSTTTWDEDGDGDFDIRWEFSYDDEGKPMFEPTVELDQFCPNDGCGARLVIKNGRNGRFAACPR